MNKEELLKLPAEELVNKIEDYHLKLIKATQNLGHPSYGISQSTTIGIDELRNELFDFLEVPESTEKHIPTKRFYEDT